MCHVQVDIPRRLDRTQLVMAMKRGQDSFGRYFPFGLSLKPIRARGAAILAICAPPESLSGGLFCNFSSPQARFLRSCSPKVTGGEGFGRALAMVGLRAFLYRLFLIAADAEDFGLMAACCRRGSGMFVRRRRARRPVACEGAWIVGQSCVDCCAGLFRRFLLLTVAAENENRLLLWDARLGAELHDHRCRKPGPG